MRNMKKVLGLIIALSVVFTITTSAVSASNLGVKNTSGTTEVKERKPLFRLYFNYDVTRVINYGGKIDTRPKTTVPTTEATTEATTQAETTATTVEEITDPSTPLAAAPVQAPVASQIVVNETPVPKAAIPSTGDSSIAGVVALSLISAASFVIAKKK